MGSAAWLLPIFCGVHLQIADDSPQPTPRDRALHVPQQQPNMERPSIASTTSQASSALDGLDLVLPSEAVSRYESTKHVKEDLGMPSCCCNFCIM